MSRQIQDIITFIQGRLNSDVDVEFMPKGDSPVDPSLQNSGRLNLAHLDGSLGVLSLLKGTTEISITHEIESSEKIIKICEDKENNAIILLCYGSEYDEII
ncbi:MAG: hypothetical protein WC343_12510, partial [Bacilli bacterium]